MRPAQELSFMHLLSYLRSQSHQLKAFLLGCAIASFTLSAGANTQATGDFDDPGNDWAPSPLDGNPTIGTTAIDKNKPIISSPLPPGAVLINEPLTINNAVEGFPILDGELWGDLAGGQNLEGPDAPAIGLHKEQKQLVIVTVRPPVGVSAEQSMQAAIERKPAVEAIITGGGDSIVNNYSELPILVAELNSDTLNALAASGLVAGLDSNAEFELLHDSTTPVVRSDLMNDSGTLGNGFEGYVNPWAVAVLDNGTRATHNAFAGRVLAEACFLQSDFGETCPNGSLSMIGPGAACGSSSDCDHGTHVSATAIGRFDSWGGLAENGVAPGAQIIAVDIAGPSGVSLATAIDGINYVLSLASAGERIAAVNLSIGGGGSAGTCDNLYPGLFTAVQALDDVGIATISPAGNNASTNFMLAPACYSNTVAVGNTDDNDTVAPNSNTSSMMDLWAPGTDVDSASSASDTAINYGLTGTSYSTPHVAGAYALLRECLSGSIFYGPGAAGADEKVLEGLSAGPLVTDNRAGGTITAPRLDVVAAAQAIWAPSDDLANARTLVTSSYGNNACTTTEAGEPYHGPFFDPIGNASTGWFSYTANSTGVYQFDTCGSFTSFNTMLAVYSGTDYTNLVKLGANDDMGASCTWTSMASSVTAPLYTGDTVLIALRGAGTQNGNFNLNVTQVSTFIPNCGGQPATHVGFSINDTIVGTTMEDVIVAGGGNDIVYGGSGNDIICLGGGDDIAYGGNGDDFIKGGDQDDGIYGNRDNDRLVGNNGEDVIYGGNDDDILFGSSGDDILYGEVGDDRVYGNNGVDFMAGGPGRDIMRGYADNDVMYGEDGIDNMTGGSGDDYMDGGLSNDTMFGNTGSDELYGGSQNDYLNGGNDPGDICDGGNGVDSATGSCETITNVP